MALRTPLTAQPSVYMTDTAGRPLDGGKVYFGQKNKDPQASPIDVFYDAGLTIAAEQPIRTKNGFLNNMGNTIGVYAANETYSVKVMDAYDRQVFYIASMSQGEDFSETILAEINRAKAAELENKALISAEVLRSTLKYSEIDSSVDLLAVKDVSLQNQINSIGGGKKSYTTEALMIADKANIPANSSIDVTNDGSNSGTYTYDGAIFTKSTYDPQAIILSKVVNVFPSKAILDASTLPDGSFAAVSDDVDLNKNGYYQKRLGVWVYLRGNTNLQRMSSTKNQLNPKDIEINKEIRSDGSILASGSGAISGLIYCFNQDGLYVSGLQSNFAPRWYRFLNQNGAPISSGYLNNNIVEGYIPVPLGAYSFQISLKQGNTSPLDISTAQIEFGTSKTSYVAFESGAVSYINNNAIAATPLKLNSVSASKNLLNKDEVLVGFEVYNDGRILAQATSIASPDIFVKGLSNITISSLVANPEILRYYKFSDASGAIVGTGSISQTATGATISVPTSAVNFQFSIKQRSASSPNLNIIQVESGTVATAYAAYARGFNTLNGVPVVAAPSSSSSSNQSASRAYGAKYLLFGDSITQTADVDNGDFTSTTFRSNWAKFAKDMLKMSVFKNYARSGASFIDTGVAQMPFMKIHHQVQTAIDNGEVPDIIILAAGTNDANIKLGTYETAMSKPIAELDKTYTADSMRWSLYKIREAFPNAVCFYCTQLQRADVEPSERATANDLMVKMAKRYNFNIIDTMNDSGIVKDFEVWQAAGRYLSDGLHTNPSGQQVQANYIVSQVVNRMSY